MSESKQFLLRKVTGDQMVESEREIHDWFQKGQCKLGDFLYDFSHKKWFRLGDHPIAAGLLQKPNQAPERKLIYFMAPGPMPMVNGPFSLKDIQQKFQTREVCEGSWVYVEGDKEWRQVRAVKALFDMLAPLPTEVPALKTPVAAPPSSVPKEADSISLLTNPSTAVELSDSAPQMEVEEQTMAFSMLGLALEENKKSANTPPGSPPSGLPSIPSTPPSAAPGMPPKPAMNASSAVGAGAPPKMGKPPTLPVIPPTSISTPGSKDRDQGSFDGLTAEIPSDPIWMIKPANSEVVSGPFKFLDVMKFLEQGKISKNDKISKTGTNRFVKIQQQYEFNVKYSVETVIEHGVEKQKILIRRRHPRVPYIADVQVMSKFGLLTGNCVNISAGGILMELAKADLNLGDIIEVKILPAIITKPIFCKSMVIGRIPKIPPAFALKFEDLKNDDKEAIEFYVQEALKREMP